MPYRNRTRLALCLLAALPVGCDDASNNAPDDAGTDDLAVQRDLVSPPDLMPQRVVATLSGGQEVPPVASGASGTATVTLQNNLLVVELDVKNLANVITGAHIHLGKPGNNGPILMGLATGPFNSPLMRVFDEGEFMPVGDIKTFAQAVDAVFHGETYVNVHTEANAGGEIRGHLGPLTIQGVLSGGQEVPPVAGMGTGLAKIDLDANHTQLAVTLAVNGLMNVTAAHLHAGAAGKNGPVIFPLAAASFSGPLTKTLTASDFTAGGGLTSFGDAVVALLGGEVYANVHTQANPGGEIRGQLGAVTLRSVLSAAQEVNKVDSVAIGSGTTTIDADQTHVTVEIDVANLANATAAHYHAAKVGMNGVVILPLAVAAFTSPLLKTVSATDLTAGGDVKTFSDAVNAMLSGQAYLNVHTQQNPGGELRGQVGPVSLQATLRGASEVPPVVSNGMGSATVSIDGRQSSIDVVLTVTGLDNITASHIHAAPMGMNGLVIFPLASMSFQSPLKKTLSAGDLVVDMPAGINSFSDAVNALFSQATYLNVHTQANPNGEIRGQIAP